MNIIYFLTETDHVPSEENSALSGWTEKVVLILNVPGGMRHSEIHNISPIILSDCLILDGTFARR